MQQDNSAMNNVGIGSAATLGLVDVDVTCAYQSKVLQSIIAVRC